MDLLLEIKNDKLSINPKTHREAARAVLFDDDNLIPLLFVSKYNYHKLPGGGIDKGEKQSEALIRECLEEIGCTIHITGELGKIVEHRTKYDMKQTSYCYYGDIVSKQGPPNFTEKEIKEGFEVVWMTLDDAITQIEKDVPINYEGSFIKERDLTFLKKMKQSLKK